jgi:hypothetical protein
MNIQKQLFNASLVWLPKFVTLYGTFYIVVCVPVLDPVKFLYSLNSAKCFLLKAKEGYFVRQRIYAIVKLFLTAFK